LTFSQLVNCITFYFANLRLGEGRGKVLTGIFFSFQNTWNKKILYLCINEIVFIMTVTARINVDTPSGRKIVRELEKHHKLVVLEYPEPLGFDGLPIETISFEQSAKEAFEYMGELYGVKFDNKYTK